MSLHNESQMGRKILICRIARAHHVAVQKNGTDPSVRTWASHGKKEDCDGLPSIMVERPRLSRRQFDDLVDCCPHGEHRKGRTV